MFCFHFILSDNNHDNEQGHITLIKNKLEATLVFAPFSIDFSNNTKQSLIEHKCVKKGVNVSELLSNSILYM